MDLTPEEKARGKEKFRAEVAENLSRRDFLMGSIAAGVVSAGSMGAFYFGYDRSVDNPLRVGVLGTGDEGNVLIGAITPDYVEVKAIADIRPYNIYRAFHGDVYDEAAQAARPGLLAKYGWRTEEEARKHVKVYEGEEGDYLWVIFSGEVEVTTHHEDKGPVKLATLGAFDYCGEISLVQGKLNTADVTTSSRSVLFRLPKATFKELLAIHSPMLEELTSVIEQRLKNTVEALLKA